jgi:hypothetical protein
MQAIIKELIGNWSILVAIGGAFLIVYITIKVKVPNIESKQTEFEKRIQEIEKMELVTKEHCLNSQANCQQLLIGKIDNLKENLKTMDNLRQEARSEFHVELIRISNFMGRVEQFMADKMAIKS